jgi:outer membrane lipoprotein-sorting protein
MILVVALLILVTIVFSGCGVIENRNTSSAIEWLNKSQRPITCMKTAQYISGYTEWTFISNTGDVYLTGPTNINGLPEVIKVGTVQIGAAP